ncbi:MAG: sulfate permease [Candidatus Muirbacterium halophilum]|nr:sulfate permease [Candidatus Muirbacterium halophilum]MCK9475708.1 sulfate permease [Candidatus Muirbacterium halophilum]
MKNEFVPKLISSLKEGYTSKHFFKDLSAGFIVGIVALPLAIAFAIASGVKPEQGLYTAIIAGFLISIFSGSRFQIGGPTGAFIVVIFKVVSDFGYEGLATATVIAGILLLIMGFSGMGSIIKFIPYPVTVGFTSGIALIIFSSQLKDFLGIVKGTFPAEFHQKIKFLIENFNNIDLYSTLLGILSLFLIVYFPKITKKIPSTIFTLVFVTLLVKIFKIPVETIGSRFGEVSSAFPAFVLPDMSFDKIKLVFPAAITIALLGGIESLLSAVVADGMTGRKHRSNMELVAQGIANIICPMFMGIPATGAIARTATNIKNGAFSPISGIVHAFTLLLILLFFGKMAALIPMCLLSAILIVVAYHMSEWRLFLKILKSPKSDVFVLLTTFLLTVLIDLTVAIQAGVFMAGLLFMKRMSEVSNADFIGKDIDDMEDIAKDAFSIVNRQIPENVLVFEINGPFFFGAAEKFKTALYQMSEFPEYLIVRMRHVPAIDATGLKALEDFIENCEKKGIIILLSGVNAQPMIAFKKSKLILKIGEDKIFRNIDNAIEFIKKHKKIQQGE